MKSTGRHKRLGYVLFGISIVLALLFLTGAYSTEQIGKYRMTSVVRRDFTEVFVIDTTTGVVKWVDSKDEGKPFEQIKIR